MFKRMLVLATIAILVIGLGCSSGSAPTVPDKGADIEGYFNSFDLSNPAVAEFTYYDNEGNVLASGLLGRDGEELYLIEGRGSQVDVDLTPLSIILAFVTYNNPTGTISTGPNAGLPYYYLGETVDYDINILSLLTSNIGGFNPPFGWFGPAKVTAEMRQAAFDPGTGKIIPGALMTGQNTYVWQGIISPGYMVLNDTYVIAPGNDPGLNVTTVRVEAPIFFGIFDIVFFDGVAGIWDPK